MTQTAACSKEVSALVLKIKVRTKLMKRETEMFTVSHTILDSLQNLYNIITL